MALLLNKEENYAGNLKILMQLNKTKLFEGQENEQDIFLDFEGQQIQALKINEHEIPIGDIRFDRHMVALPADKLSSDDGYTNSIEIEFVNTYVTNSAGLHRF